MDIPEKCDICGLEKTIRVDKDGDIGLICIKCYGSPKWISVEDRLPETDDDVLVYNFKDGIHLGHHDKDRVNAYIEEDGSAYFINTGWATSYEWSTSYSPTHWMPIPKPPNIKSSR
jgi:hypothetical protein